MSEYSRPSSGFAFKFGGLNTKSPADKLAESKFAVAQNIRAYSDTEIRSRPGLALAATSSTGNPVLGTRAYAAIESDNLPRLLMKCNTSNSNASVFLDNGTVVDTGYAPFLGASFIPYRPNQSPQSWMYVGDANQYRKLSAPSSTGVVTAQKCGIAEPQVPVDAGISEQNYSYVGWPTPGSAYTAIGSANAPTTGNRITDTVQGVYSDPTGCGINTLQVSGGSSSLTAGIFTTGSVTAYFFSAPGTNGVFNAGLPTSQNLSPGAATATATGTSLMFNPPEYNGVGNPPVQPMQWAQLTGNVITGYTEPWLGATTDYYMCLLFDFYIPVAGSYVLNIDHDDGMQFAISGATLVSGPNVNPNRFTATALSNLTFAGGGIAGTNQEGINNDTFVIHFPAAGVYACEVDYCQKNVNQSLELYSNGAYITSSDGTIGYQRYMALEIGSSVVTVQDVFPPLPTTLAIESIYYYSSTTVRPFHGGGFVFSPNYCIITPASLSPVSGTDGTSLYEQDLLSGIRRGALVRVGSEVCLVLNVTNGPTGTVCFETTTQSIHTTSDVLSGVSAISIFGSATVGQTITSEDITFAVGTGVGAINSAVTSNPFVSNDFSFQTDDNIHFSVNIDALSNLTEMKVLFDVGDGTFTRNFYFYTVRPNDIVDAVANQITQLGAAQVVSQRATIDEEQAAESNNQGFTSSSAQSTTGDSQWSEILFPISSLTRVGNDQTKTLQNVNAVQVLFNCTAGINVQFNSLSVLGGYSPDVGTVGAPYQYIIRPRSSITGALGNPSPAMRYGVNPRRAQVSVYVPLTYADTQADTWDVFRFGGSLTAYTYIGSVTIGSSNQFYDTYEDEEIVSNEQIDYENFEPWPTIDLPLTTTASTVSGTVAVVAIPTASQANVLRYLPGNLVTIEQQTYTLWTRPLQIGTTSNFLFQFVENAGEGANVTANIYEPAMANQILPYLWGPTEDGGNVFGCGDPLRPGFVYFSKNFAPDAAPDSYNLELCPPSEPLLGGEVLNGNSYVASTERWWQLRPSFGGANQFSPVEAPVGRGLAAPFGHCTDGSKIFFVAKDGIYVTAGGHGQSLTDADLYNLFPHDGISGQNVTYNGVTNYAPDYGRTQTFRLAYWNSYLFFDYQDSTGTTRNLVFDIRHEAWSTDVKLGGIGASVHYGIEQQAGSLDSSDQTYKILIVGGADGNLYNEKDNQIDGTYPIVSVLATREWTAGDDRAPKLFGDLYLDFLNPTGGATNLAVSSMSLGKVFSTTNLAQSANRQQLPVDLGGGTYSYALGIFLSWTIPVAMPPLVFYTWQPSYITKPETTANRYEDLDNAGTEGNKFFQGFLLEALCPTTKQLSIFNGDTQTIQQTFAITHPIQQVKAYSFTTPFNAHMVRFESSDGVDWNFFNIKWVFQQTPEIVQTWWTQFSAPGWEGFGHCFSAEIAYAAQAPVVFTLFYDGNTQNYTIPSTGGVYQKYFLNFQANKGKLYAFRAQSTAGFNDLQIWEEDCVIQLGGWSRTEAYRNHLAIGGARGDQAPI